MRKNYIPSATTALRHDHEEGIYIFSNVPCTLLIPEELRVLMEEKLTAEFGGRFPAYFEYLIRKYRDTVMHESFPRAGSVNTLYQPGGAGLRRVSFRGRMWDWAVLGCLSVGMGVSRCYLFVLFLMMDLGLIETVHTLPEREGGREYSFQIVSGRYVSSFNAIYHRKLRFVLKKHRQYDYGPWF